MGSACYSKRKAAHDKSYRQAGSKMSSAVVECSHHVAALAACLIAALPAYQCPSTEVKLSAPSNVQPCKLAHTRHSIIIVWAADAPAWLRAYIPCIAYQPAEGAQGAAVLPSLFARARQVAGPQDSIAHLAIQDVRAPIKGIALVATRELHNEELLLNYRLSPHVSRPSWYTPVDAEEDQRRWG